MSMPAHRQAAFEHESICDKLDRLTEELSEVMAEYMGGKFQAIVSGDDVRFVRIKADADTAGAQAAALSNVLNDVRHGDWQTTLDLEAGFVLIALHEPRVTGRGYRQTDYVDLNLDRPKSGETDHAA